MIRRGKKKSNKVRSTNKLTIVETSTPVPSTVHRMKQRCKEAFQKSKMPWSIRFDQGGT